MAHALDATVDDRSLVINRVRSDVCRILDEHGPTRIAELATRLVDRRAGFPADAVERLIVALHHDHLPRLADREILEYCAKSGRVSIPDDVGIDEAPIADVVRVTDEG